MDAKDAVLKEMDSRREIRKERGHVLHNRVSVSYTLPTGLWSQVIQMELENPHHVVISNHHTVVQCIAHTFVVVLV